jgi:hypothetical protein
METLDDKALSEVINVRPVAQSDFLTALETITSTAMASCASTPAKDDEAHRRKMMRTNNGVAQSTQISAVTVKREREDH